MQKTKKLLSIIIFILMMFLYCIVVMAFLIKINFNHWLLEFIVTLYWVLSGFSLQCIFEGLLKKNDNKKK